MRKLLGIFRWSVQQKYKARQTITYILKNKNSILIRISIQLIDWCHLL